MQLVPGVEVEGYRLDRVLGRGGMGSVWAATEAGTRAPVALKFLHAHLHGERIRLRFLREARAADAVRHPNVVRILRVLETELWGPMIVMELLRGQLLSEHLRRRSKLPLDEAAAILLPVVSAVGCAHAAGIVHRDLKPGNILLETTSGPSASPKVLDFGIAKMGTAAGETLLSLSGAVLGTPFYMAPEQAFGERNIDHRADIWALGVIVYECVAGVRPFQARVLSEVMRALMTGTLVPLRQVAPHLPENLLQLVDKTLSLRREQRPTDLRELFDVLRGHAALPSIPAPAPCADIFWEQESGGDDESLTQTLPVHSVGR